MNFIINSSDKYGVAASVLCMLHCSATPLLYFTQAHNLFHVNDISFLWLSMNYFFLLISSLAVYFSIQNSTKIFVKVLLFVFWLAFSFLILNEGFKGFHIPEYYTYLFASILALLHIYNLKYCKCKNEECCSQNK
ncbi:MAG: MerC domain-containing protein [Flavobacteriaceae bacterium]|nr:MerC domain-containing protein [Flavobacteriaceae bacterium]